MLGSPESPGYLAAKGKRDEAVSIATKLWGAKGVAQLGESAGASSSRKPIICMGLEFAMCDIRLVSYRGWQLTGHVLVMLCCAVIWSNVLQVAARAVPLVVARAC
jgi:hypothetical protein